MTQLTRSQERMIKNLDAIEAEAMKNALPGDIYAVTRAQGQATIERLIARGWEILKDNEAAYGKLVAVATLRIELTELEGRS